MAEPKPTSRGKRLALGAQRLNRDPRLVWLVRRARERALGDEGHIDRLSVSRGRASDIATREFANLRGGSPGLLGELGLSALQGWQRLAETRDRGRGKVDVAILFTDLVGFSEWALAAGDSATIDLLQGFADTAEPEIARRQGTVVKRLGDGLMAVFSDSPAAVDAAVAIHVKVAEVKAPGYRPQLRTGIHLGKPRRLGSDYFGVDVNIAARLTEAANPGEILVSDAVVSALPEVGATAEKRRFGAKGVPDELSAYSLGDPTYKGGPQ